MSNFQQPAFPVKLAGSDRASDQGAAIAASGESVKTKKPLTIPVSGSSCRGDWRLPFVNETSGLWLVAGLFPETVEFTGDAVLKLVEPGLYRKDR
jgi:hypothetical protein